MVVLNLVWYVFVGLVFYRAEVMVFLGRGAGGGDPAGRGGSPKAQPSGRATNTGDERIEQEVDAALMGSPRLPDGVEVKNSAQVSFSAPDVEGKYGQVGLVADVVQELKEIFSQLEQNAGDKKDFFRLLGKLKEEYGPLGGHPSVGALTGFVLENVSFHLGEDEIANLWY